MALVFIEGQHLYRNVPCSRVLFQVIEDGPAQHVGEKYIQGYGGGMKFAGQRESFRAPGSEQDLEAFLPGEIAQNSRVVRIVFDDQQRSIVRLQGSPGRPESVPPEAQPARSSRVQPVDSDSELWPSGYFTGKADGPL